MTKTSIYLQHGEHIDWINKLAFYTDEIAIMQTRLEEVSSKNNAHEIRKEIEHFQNQFIIQKAHVHDMRQVIKQDEKQIQANILSNPVASDHRKTEDHAVERESIQSLELTINDLRKEFKTFLSKYL